VRKLELFLVPPTCAETRETVRTEPQPSESECSDDALSSKRDSVGGGAAEQARRARAPTLPGVSVSGPYGLNEVAAGRSGLQVGSGLASPPDSGGPDGPGDARDVRRLFVIVCIIYIYIYILDKHMFKPNLIDVPDRMLHARRDSASRRASASVRVVTMVSRNDRFKRR
jgi:hypothetical protein